MAYTKTVWKARQGVNLNRFSKSQETSRSVILTNAPDAVTDPGTQFSADHMNNIEQGIEDAHSTIDSLGEGLAAEAEARLQGDDNTLVKAKKYTDGHNENSTAHADIREILNDLAGLPEWDADDHILTFTARNGATLEVNLPLEELAQDIDYDPSTKEIVLIKKDGSEIRVDVSDLIDVYEGSIGTNIQITVEEGIIKAKLLAGTVGEAALTAALLAKINNKLDAEHDTAVDAHANLMEQVVKRSEIGAANGVPGLDGSGKVPIGQLPEEIGGNFGAIYEAIDIGDVGTLASAKGYTDQIANRRVRSSGADINPTDHENQITMQDGRYVDGSPDYNAHFQYITLQHNPVWFRQLAFNLYNKEIFTRAKHENVMTSWDKLALMPDVGPRIGEIYIRWPQWGLAISPPTPAAIYGGSWQDVSHHFVGRFPRIKGGNAGALGQALDDAIRNIWGSADTGAWSGLGTQNPEDSAGAIYSWAMRPARHGIRSGWNESNSLNGSIRLELDAARIVPTASENRPICVAVEIWQRLS